MPEPKKGSRTIRGETYELVVLKVLERDELGRPSKVLIGYDDTTFKVGGGEEFFTAYVYQSSVKPRTLQ